MRHGPVRSIRPRRRPRRRNGLGRLALLALMGTPFGLATFERAPVVGPPPAALAQAGPVLTAAVAPGEAYGWMLDPTRTPGAEAFVVRREVAREAAVLLAKPVPLAAKDDEARAVRPSDRLAALDIAEAASAEPTLLTVPLPVPRPAEFAFVRPSEPARAVGPVTAGPQRLAERPASRRAKPVIVASTEVDSSSFFDKLFGTRSSTGQASTGQALAYASTGALAPEARPSLSPSPFGDSAGTAVYDITAGTVTLPSGEKLEAHSGLGPHFDDPRFAHLRMRGPTPPGIYDLREREALFHGVRAIRLTPVGGSAAIHGRDGILAHTYMLGARGDSNGCVSFRQYDRFLQAYLRGEVRRLVVVAGNGQDGPASRPGRLFGAL